MAYRRKPLARALALNTIVLVVEVAGGAKASSFSVILDGGHNLSDEVALALLPLAGGARHDLRFPRLAAAGNWGWPGPCAMPPATTLRSVSPYVHNLGDKLRSLAPVLAGVLVLVSGRPSFDPLVALGIAP